MPSLLAFTAPQTGSGQSQYAPLRSLSSHRGPITSLAIGHGHMSTNIAISASLDKTCLVWDYRDGTLLRTFLLPLAPLCLALDPVDRALYASFEDGGVQLIDFFKNTPLPSGENSHHGPSMPTQPPVSDRWHIPMEAASRALSLAVNHDGTTVITGHEDGRVLSWDVAKGKYSAKLCDLQAPVTNLQMLELEGFPQQPKAKTVSTSIVKPRYESSLASMGASGGWGSVPAKHALTALFQAPLPLPRLVDKFVHRDSLMDHFEAALNQPSLPPDILDEGMATFSEHGDRHAGSTETEASLQEEAGLLRAQLAHSRAAQMAHAERAVELNGEVLRLREIEEVRNRAKAVRRTKKAKAAEIMRKKYMGEQVDEEAEVELSRPWEGEGDVGSSTDETEEG